MTPSSPVEAEALGLEHVTARFADRDWSIPADVDAWPLNHVAACLAVNAESRFTVSHYGLVYAMRALLGGQWTAFLAAAPKRGQLAAASHVFAAAVGMPQRVGSDSDVAFGSLPWLLLLLERWPTQVESDLNQFWGLDYRDRWRFADGQRKLTLRQIHARMTNLPTDSAVAVALNGGRLLHTGAELLLMDLFEAHTGRRHPSRPLSKEQLAEREAAARKAAEDKAKHDARMAAREERRKTGGLARAQENRKRETTNA